MGSRLVLFIKINRGNGRATIVHKAQDYFGLRLFQTFHKPAQSSIEGFNRCAPFITGISPFEPFQSFNRFCSVKALRRFKSSNLAAVQSSMFKEF